MSYPQTFESLNGRRGGWFVYERFSLFFGFFGILSVSMQDLISRLKADGILRSPEVIRVFEAVDRTGFVTPELSGEAGCNEPLPIGYGQTISQPLTVAFMLELLQAEPGNCVLDVGAGSGWTAALLATIVGPTGFVYAMERIPQLRQFAADNLQRANVTNVEIDTGDGSRGWAAHAPYDRIHVAAAYREVPRPLIEQLKIGGRLVMPVGEYVQDVVLFEKQARGKYREQRYPGFQFVPLVTEESKA